MSPLRESPQVLAQCLMQTFHHLPINLCTDVVWLMLGRAFPCPLVQQELVGFLRCLSPDLAWRLVTLHPTWRHPEVSSVTHKWGPHHISAMFWLHGARQRRQSLLVKTFLWGEEGLKVLLLARSSWDRCRAVGMPEAGASPWLSLNDKQKEWDYFNWVLLPSSLGQISLC